VILGIDDMTMTEDEIVLLRWANDTGGQKSRKYHGAEERFLHQGGSIRGRRCILACGLAGVMGSAAFGNLGQAT
jgi:hypothetical protein